MSTEKEITLASEIYKMAVDLQEQGKCDEALEAYERAVKLNPQDARAWNNIGVIFCKQDRYEEAIAAYNKAIDIDSKAALIWFNKGFTLEIGFKEYYGALKAYNMAISIYLRYIDAWVGKARVLGPYAIALRQCKPLTKPSN